jgi:ribosomal-protein-alanine N-acetyltransferase
MTAIPNFDHLPYLPMEASDVDEVLALEEQVYPYPWSRANFTDSLASGYDAWVLRNQNGSLAGYFLMMHAVDESHLLNVAVNAAQHGKGFGRYLMEKICACARGRSMESVLLEVRPSNERALKVYDKYGFVRIGLRKGYYPAGAGQREDAIVMRYVL